MGTHDGFAYQFPVHFGFSSITQEQDTAFFLTHAPLKPLKVHTEL